AWLGLRAEAPGLFATWQRPSCPLSYPSHSSPVHTAALPSPPHPSPLCADHCHTLHTPLLYILPTIIPFTFLSSTYCPLSNPPHFSPVYTATCHTLHTPLLYILPTVIPSTLLSCTNCSLSYPPYSSLVYTGHCHTFCTSLLYILPTVIPSTLFSCIYCPLSYLLHFSPTHISSCHTLCTPLMHVVIFLTSLVLEWKLKHNHRNHCTVSGSEQILISNIDQILPTGPVQKKEKQVLKCDQQ
ncbi:hypothetical protein AB205_0157030, partial [Aquarana catesbeiana]